MLMMYSLSENFGVLSLIEYERERVRERVYSLLANLAVAFLGRYSKDQRWQGREEKGRLGRGDFLDRWHRYCFAVVRVGVFSWRVCKDDSIYRGMDSSIVEKMVVS